MRLTWILARMIRVMAAVTVVMVMLKIAQTKEIITKTNLTPLDLNKNKNYMIVMIC